MDIERRTSYRCRTQTMDVAAILRVDRRDTVVRVIEESAGGYGVLVPAGTALEPEQRVTLSMSESFVECRVVHIAPHGQELRVGLQRLRERSLKPSMGGIRGLLSARGGVDRGSAVVPGLALLLGLSIGLVLTYSQWDGDRGAVHLVTQATFDPDAELAGMDDATILERLLHLRSGGELNLTKRLGLSGYQQKEVAKILDRTAAGLTALQRNTNELGTEGATDRALLLVRAAWLETREVLTREQRKSFDDLLE